MYFWNAILGTHLPLTCVMSGRQNFISKDISVGDYSFIGHGCTIYPKVKLGRFVLIAPEVKIVGADHEFSIPGTPIILSGRELLQETVIGDDVWIGTGVFVKAGINIGNGAIVAAHSVVTKSVSPYSIVAGNPARLVRMRFTDDQILEHEAMLNTQTNFRIDPNSFVGRLI